MKLDRVPDASCGTRSLKNSDLDTLFLEMSCSYHATDTCANYSNTFASERHVGNIACMLKEVLRSFARARENKTQLFSRQQHTQASQHSTMKAIYLLSAFLAYASALALVSTASISTGVSLETKRDGGHEWHHERPCSHGMPATKTDAPICD